MLELAHNKCINTKVILFILKVSQWQIEKVENCELVVGQNELSADCSLLFSISNFVDCEWSFPLD